MASGMDVDMVPSAPDDSAGDPSTSGAGAGVTESERFIMELEFVSLLANPQYLHYLGQHRYFEDPAFVKYLEYLQYWKQPKYSKYIVYPHALYFLEMLQSPKFRQAMAYPQNKELMHTQQFYFWQHWRERRAKDAVGEELGAGGDGGGGDGGGNADDVKIS